MKVPYSWLADWVDIPWDATELGSRLTMAGFELDGLEPAAPAFSGVIVAEILSAERHPPGRQAASMSGLHWRRRAGADRVRCCERQGRAEECFGRGRREVAR